uniref:Nucleolar protein 10 n=1 Tax=Globodera rostochiensis TaxID=31243 RepID=A0A914I4F8_GLORO
MLKLQKLAFIAVVFGHLLNRLLSSSATNSFASNHIKTFTKCQTNFHQMDNESVTTNKSPATTCCGSCSNKSIVAINKYKYGTNNNKSGTTCCCGSVSIETGTYVAAIVLCVLCLLEAIEWFIDLPSPLLIWLGAYSVFKACICLLVIYGQKECNPWLFVPYMIFWVMEILGRVLFVLAGYICVFHRTAKDYEGFTREYNKERCIFLLAYYAVTFPLTWSQNSDTPFGLFQKISGKALPDWITAKKRRKLEKQDVDIRKRIQLVQDLEMPSVSHTVTFSPDGHYFFATGSYKPMVKCYDLDELTLKFERGLDADVVKFLMLSEDYSKFILLEEERHVEFHTNYGRCFRLRIPNFGRDMAFCREISEVNIVGCHSDIFRLNLELGRFHEPLRSEADSLTCCAFNDEHQLFVCGTGDARVEAWDYRCRRRVAMLDCVLNKAITLELDMDGGSEIEVSSLCFKDALHLAVGLSNGYVLLYDLRSSRPYLSKNHNFGLPITRLEFAKEQELVLSMDGRALKAWNEHNGQPFTSIEPGTDLRDFSRYPNSGIIMFANDDPKIQQYFVPALGPAPRWCTHLESITDELESEKPTVYDDFKFVTKSQLEELGLSKLVGTSALRAYMHGFFVDMSTYKKARNQCQISAVEAYREKKLQQKLEQERAVNFVKRRDNGQRKLPKVNKELAARLQAELSIDAAASDDDGIDGKASASTRAQPKKHALCGIMDDARFESLFVDPDMQIDEDSEKYKQLESLMNKLEAKKQRMERNS